MGANAGLYKPFVWPTPTNDFGKLKIYPGYGDVNSPGAGVRRTLCLFPVMYKIS